MTDVVFINDTSSGMNWGSQATCKSFRDLIAKTDSNISHTIYKINLRKYEGNSELPPTSYIPAAAKEVLMSIKKKNMSGIYRGTQELNDAIPKKFSQFDEFAHKALQGGALQEEINAIKATDVVLINGEGLVYSSADRCTRAIFFFAYLSKKFLDTDCVMANTTLDIQDETLGKMVENVLPILDDVVFREPKSAEIYSQYCRRAKTGADPVFSYHPNIGQDYLTKSIQRDALDIRPYSTNTFDSSKPYICVAGSSIFSTKSEYNFSGYIKLCKNLKNICNQIVLVVSARSDEKILSLVAEKLNLNILGLNVSIRDSMALLANADVYIGGRYHPTIFASKGGVPIIPFSANTHKIEGVLEMLDVKTTIFNPFDLNNSINEITDLANYYMDDPSDFNHITEVMGDLSNRSNINVQYLQSYI